jgi:hypothetical protein
VYHETKILNDNFQWSGMFFGENTKNIVLQGEHKVRPYKKQIVLLTHNLQNVPDH